MTSTHTHATQTGDTLVVEPQRFAIVPEWVLDLDVSDAPLRLYALLLRYGGTSGSRMPSRRLLAERMRRSVDSVDRAMRDLETAGLVRVERRRRGRGAGRCGSDPREGRGGVAADLRPNRKQETHSPPPPTSPPRPPRQRAPRAQAQEEPTTDRVDEVLAQCGITDLTELAARCRTARRALGLSPTRRAAPCLLAAVQLVVLRGWPAEQIQPAVLTLAADRETRSPMRVAEAGPWWDQPPRPPPELAGVDLAALEAELDDVAERRPALQAQARAELTAEHLPLTRATVTARAVQILHRPAQGAGWWATERGQLASAGNGWSPSDRMQS